MFYIISAAAVNRARFAPRFASHSIVGRPNLIFALVPPPSNFGPGNNVVHGEMVIGAQGWARGWKVRIGDSATSYSPFAQHSYAHTHILPVYRAPLSFSVPFHLARPPSVQRRTSRRSVSPLLLGHAHTRPRSRIIHARIIRARVRVLYPALAATAHPGRRGAWRKGRAYTKTIHERTRVNVRLRSGGGVHKETFIIKEG